MILKGSSIPIAPAPPIQPLPFIIPPPPPFIPAPPIVSAFTSLQQSLKQAVSSKIFITPAPSPPLVTLPQSPIPPPPSIPLPKTPPPPLPPFPPLKTLPQSPVKSPLPQIPFSPIQPSSPTSPGSYQSPQSPSQFSFSYDPAQFQSQSVSLDESDASEIMNRLLQLQNELGQIDIGIVEQKLQSVQKEVDTFKKKADLSIDTNQNSLEKMEKSLQILTDSVLNSTHSSQQTTVSDISGQLQDPDSMLQAYPALNFISVEDDINNSQDLTDEEKKLELENLQFQPLLTITQEVEKKDDDIPETDNIIAPQEPPSPVEIKTKYELASDKMKENIKKTITQFEIKNKVADTKRRQEWGITSKILPHQMPATVKVTRSKGKQMGNETFQKLQKFEQSGITSKIQREERTHGTRSSLRDTYGITEEDLPMVKDKPQVKNPHKPSKKKK